MTKIRSISPTIARRLILSRQHLDGAERQPDAETMLRVVRDLGCLQLDPISAVAKSHTLVLFSRFGNYNLETFDQLLWQDRSLFEYWAHVASIVLTEDYPIHHLRMRNYPNHDGEWGQKIREWAEKEETVRLRELILSRIRAEGAQPSRVFVDKSGGEIVTSGWTSDRNVNRVIDMMWHRGDLMVAKRSGGHRHWDLAERCLPEWTPRELLSQEEVVSRAAQKAIRALGVARPNHIPQHYTRARYPDLDRILKQLEADGKIERVQIKDANESWSGEWYLHQDDVPLLERVASGDWQPRTTLLSPFDNLICDRKRTELIFNFKFTIEIYVPKHKRQYGYYVLPILQGDRLIGRIDPLMDRKKKSLIINNVYAEPNAPDDAETVTGIKTAVQSLADFLGAKTIDYAGTVPAGWSKLK